MAKQSPKLIETRLGLALQSIAQDVVGSLGYVAAMVSTYEEDGTLPIRASYLDPHTVSAEQIEDWEAQIGVSLSKPVRSTGKQLARINVHHKEDRNNLGVQAVRKRKPVRSSSLFTLFTPSVPPETRPFFEEVVQPALGVRQVIAVPFFLESVDGAETAIVGNLFAAKNGDVTPQEELILTAFGRQAAAAIEIERQRLQALQVARQLTTEIQTRIGREDEILQQIVRGVVNVLGYIGAMLATYEKSDCSLPLRAVYFDPALEIEKWENRVLRLMPNPISIANPDPDVARVYIENPAYRENLSTQAVKTREPVTSNDLYTLFVPFIPSAARPVLKLLQRTVHITQVIAVPFFLETAENGQPEIVGNLFAATTHPDGFKAEEIELLKAFGQQAAAGIRNARLYREVEQLLNRSEQQRLEIEDLYRKGEERRQVAELFGKMAFNAAANVHTLRNHIGAFSTHLQLTLMYKQDPQRLLSLLESGPRYLQRLQEAIAILDSLHEPWNAQSDELVVVNEALQEAVQKVVARLNVEDAIYVEMNLGNDLPTVYTTYEMLVEAFKILVKNGMEAILEKHHLSGDTMQARLSGMILGVLRIESHMLDLETLEILVQDNGAGIPVKSLTKIFDLRFSTKVSGMGFGLFWLKDYVEGLGGRVWVESRVGEGTTFHVLLPVTQGTVGGKRAG